MLRLHRVASVRGVVPQVAGRRHACQPLAQVSLLQTGPARQFLPSRGTVSRQLREQAEPSPIPAMKKALAPA